MRTLLKKPVLLGALVGVLFLILCVFVPIPMYDGIFHYDYKLVHVQTESKIALSYYFGIGLERTMANGILPNKFELKPIGYALFILIHVGLPALIAIRFKMSNSRNKIENPDNE